jgi:hypothetical protein
VRLRVSFRVENKLRYTFSVPKVDKHQVAVVPVGVHPARQRHFFAGVAEPKLAARMCSFQHHRNLSQKIPLSPLFIFVYRTVAGIRA